MKTPHIVDIRNFHLAPQLAESREQADERMKELADFFGLSLLGFLGCPSYDGAKTGFEERGEAWGPYDMHGVLSAEGRYHPTARPRKDFPSWTRETFDAESAPENLWAALALTLLSAELLSGKDGRATCATWFNTFYTPKEYGRTEGSLWTGAFARGVFLTLDTGDLARELGELCGYAGILLREAPVNRGSHYGEEAARAFRERSKAEEFGKIMKAVEGMRGQ